MPHNASPVGDYRVPVYDTYTQCPNPSAEMSLSESHTSVQDSRVNSSSCPADPGGSDGGELLSARESAGGVRPRQPDSNDGAGRGGNGFRLDGYTPPLTRSPGDPWHSEEYLVNCLVKLHGWRWQEARVLRGPWPWPGVRSFMHPEGE